MPIDKIEEMLKCTDARKRLAFQMVLQCAPLLKGLKPACILNLKHDLYKELNAVLAETDISYVMLQRTASRCLILFYREKTFAKFICQDSVQCFLKEQGYARMAIPHVIKRLKNRMKLFANSENAFPHEMGVLLGYPLADVKGFMLHRGSKALYTGYWKVYENLQKAKETFREYDLAKHRAIYEFALGKTMTEITARQIA